MPINVGTPKWANGYFGMCWSNYRKPVLGLGLGNVTPEPGGAFGERFMRSIRRWFNWCSPASVGPSIGGARRRLNCICAWISKLTCPSLRSSIPPRNTTAGRRRSWARASGLGKIVVFDRAYKDLRHLWQLTQRGVFWVTRTLERQDFRVVKRRLKKAQGRILRDDVIRLQGPKSKELYPEKLRRVLALIPIDGQDVELEFLTNNLDWQPSSVADLYRCRWEIEVFFRQLKQTLQLSDFLGNSLNAVQWQLWMALLVYVLLKYLAYVSRWQHSFIRVWTTVRAVVWERWDLQTILRRYGTARSSLRLLPQPHQLYFPCF